MKVYWFKIPCEGNRFDIKGGTETNMYDFYLDLGKKRFNGNWPRFEFRCIKKKGFTDFPDITHCLGPIIRENMLNALPTYFQEECEPIPFMFKNETFYLLNVPTVEGLLLEKKHYNVAASELEKSQGYVHHFPWCVLDKEKLNGHNIFQAYVLCVSEEFKEKYELLGMRGATFQEVWDSDEGSEPNVDRIVSHLKKLHPPRISHTPPKTEKFSSLSIGELKEKIVSICAEQLFDYALGCELPAELQMMWFFDGQHIELASYIQSEDIKNELILTNDKTIECMLHSIFQLYKLEHPHEDAEEEGCFSNKLFEICIAIGNQIDSALSKMNISIKNPIEYD